MGTKAEELIKLARKNYRYLSEAELKLLRKVAEGEGADYRSSDQTENDPKEGSTWGQKRSPDINVIIWLCTDKEAIECLTHKGISITGAKIDGCLDLDFVDLDVPLIFHCCYFSEGVRLNSAKVKLLNFSGSYIAGYYIGSSKYAIFAQSVEVKSFVFLSNGFQAKGEVSFYGATIGGNFSCSQGSFHNPEGNAILAQGAEIKGSVFLDDGFQAKGEVSFYGATIGGNFQANTGIFDNPNGTAIIAEGVYIKGSVYLRDGVESKGEVSFYGATIGENFSCSRANFHNPEGNAILAQGAEIKGSVFLDDGFQSKGGVSFYSATIGGNFQANTGIFDNPNGTAIIAEGVYIKGSVYLRDGVESKGEVSFYGATIDGNFSCSKGIFHNPEGNAILAQGAEIKGSVFLDNGFESKGKVSFYSATIGVNFSCSKGSFDNPLGNAILAQGAEIKGSVFLDDDFQSKGEVSFYGATIGGNFEATKGIFENPNGTALKALNANIKGNILLNGSFQAKGEVSFYNANIGGTFFLSKVKNTQEMTLDLTLAKINSLSDQEDSWPEKNNLYLDGLVYNSIDNDSPVDSQSRLKWIRLQNLEENFSPQPYEQLAKVLRMSGHEEAAKDILIAKQNDRRRYVELKGFRWGLNYILGLTIDHGYRPQKILIGVLVFLILGWGIFSWGESQNLMSPSRIIALVNPSSTQKIIDSNYPKFNAFMYSVDAFLPIIDFHQESYWLPNANIKGDIEIPLNYSNIILYKNAWIGSLLRYYLWFHIFMGWVLTSLGVAGFTGLVRRLE